MGGDARWDPVAAGSASRAVATGRLGGEATRTRGGGRGRVTTGTGRDVWGRLRIGSDGPVLPASIASEL